MSVEKSMHFMRMIMINGRRQKFEGTAACSISTKADKDKVTNRKELVNCRRCLKLLEKRKGV